MTPTNTTTTNPTHTIAEATTKNGAWLIRVSAIGDNTGTNYVVRTFDTRYNAASHRQASFATEGAARAAGNRAWRAADGTIPGAD